MFTDDGKCGRHQSELIDCQTNCHFMLAVSTSRLDTVYEDVNATIDTASYGSFGHITGMVPGQYEKDTAIQNQSGCIAALPGR